MSFPRRALLAAAVLATGLAAFAFGANAQTAPSERIVGYSVDAHTQYVLIQRADGALRTCSRNRDTALRTPSWQCRDEGALPR